MATMRAARVNEYKAPYQIELIDVPKPKENRLLVKTGAAGFCHTGNPLWMSKMLTRLDVMIKDGFFSSPLPLTGSHEPCSTVVEVGSKVKGFKTGDRVGTLPFLHPCGKCPDCLTGTHIYCNRMEGALGINTDDAFSEVSRNS
jgi:D-arabinose 1-dehydrogenase-like Zn-dependent alcohol dehydrogenase